jgi:hypothetical protein
MKHNPQIYLWINPHNFHCNTHFVYENSWSPYKSISKYKFHVDPQFQINSLSLIISNGNRLYKKIQQGKKLK